MTFREQFMVRPGSKVKLSKWDPADTAGFARKKDVLPLVRENVKRLADLQYLLYAEGRRAMLVVLQAMDAGGKDGTIRHVMGTLNPQGCPVTSFKAPTPEELAHDFLWRIHKAVPKRGEIGIFNRSHYGDVLVVRVHNFVPRSVWSKRYRQINSFEKLLAEAGVHILKFYLHVSKREQLRRLKKRLDNPAKHWKANPKDFDEREHWDDYMRAYEAALARCSTECAPWFVIPADHKWFRNLAVSQILVETLEALDMKLPEPEFDVEAIKAKYLG